MDFKRMFDFSNMDDKTKGMIKMALILIGIFVAFILFFSYCIIGVYYVDSNLVIGYLK